VDVLTPSPVAGTVVWLIIIVLCVLVFWRMKTRRRHIGSAAAGTVYDMIGEEKRNAVEIVVEDKAAARDFEHVADEPDADSRKTPARR
jgi:hypothetical protein